MKERPILFSAPMVCAILEGRKTVTRRIVKGTALAWLQPGMFIPAYVADPANHMCPYGHAGDRLWVREAVWLPRPATSHDLREGADTWPKCIYSADTDAPEIEWMREQRWKQRPSIHMPRWASRITLEVTGVRVERLQDISRDDAIAEGCKHPLKGAELENVPGDFVADERTQFARLWQSINGPGSWAANPWVWAVDFQRIQQAYAEATAA